MYYLVLFRDQIFVEGQGFLFFTKNNGKYISTKLNAKYSQNLLDHAKKSTTDTLKTSSKRFIQKAAQKTGDLIGNKTTDRITKDSKNLQ